MALHTNIVSDKELKEIMGETLEFLSNTLKNTLGPYGTTTIIQDRFINHQITKDGYSLLKKIFIEEDEARTILDLVKKISRNLVRKVGDGSTSSIIIANSLYKSLVNVIEKYNIPPKNLLVLLETLAEVLAEEIKAESKPISPDMDELKYIAAVSTNNDLDYGVLVSEIFKEIGKYGFINLEKAKGEETYYEVTNGFELPRGWVLDVMVNQGDEKTCEYHNPKVLLCDGIMTESDLPLLQDLFGEVCGAKSTPMVIIAKGFDNAFCTFMHINIKNGIPLLAVEIAVENKNNQDRLNDLSINLGADIYRKSQGEVLDQYDGFKEERLGSCKKVIATDTFCRLIEGQGDEKKIQERVDLIQAKLLERSANETYIEMDQEIFNLRKRIAALQNSMAVLYVGGATEDAKETDKYLLEDAVFACRSALNFGYIPGGNLIIPIIIRNKKEEIISKIENKLGYPCTLIEDVIDNIYVAFTKSFEAVLSNRFFNNEKQNQIIEECVNNRLFFNLKTDNYEKMSETRIINSAETDIEILKSAISIIGLLATSNQFIRINTMTK